MKSEDKKIEGIVKELLSNSLASGAEEISIKISRKNSQTTIEVEDNGRGMDKDTLMEVRRTLAQPYRKDMQIYYDGLVGHSSSNSGLNLVGLLVDQAEVESSEKGTKIIVERNRAIL